MGAYIFRRILLMAPTLFGVMVVSFVVVQFAPGGPIEKVVAQIQGMDVAATARVSGGTQAGDFAGQSGGQGSGAAADPTLRIAALRGSIPSSSPSSRSSSASTSRRSNASA